MSTYQEKSMHRYEASILRTLRWSESARFSDLMRPTGLTSDDFKFYLRKLCKHGYVEKLPNGRYSMTPPGKELANNLDEQDQQVQKAVKLSVVLVIMRRQAGGQVEYLMQQRLRQPFLKYWGFLSGPVRWGELAEATAARELHKQTGLTADCRVNGFLRIREYAIEDKQLLEDKLFTVMVADKSYGELDNSWGGGINRWMTVDEINQATPGFRTTRHVIAMLQTGQKYASFDAEYRRDEY